MRSSRIGIKGKIFYRIAYASLNAGRLRIGMGGYRMNGNTHSASEEQVYLLLDGSVVSRAENCELLPCRPVKDPANPIIRQTEEWEGWGPYLPPGEGIVWMPEKQKYRMDYMAFGDYFYRTGYLESDDAMEWTKPPRSVTENSLHYCYDPRPETPKERRYAHLGFVTEKDRYFNIITFASDRDCVTEVKKLPAFTSDMIQALFDPRLGHFVVYYKLWKLRAMKKDDTAAEGYSPIVYYAIGFDIKKHDDGWADLIGLFVTLGDDGRTTTEYRAVTVMYGNQSNDDGGGGNLCGLWTSKRVVCRAESLDFVNWFNCAEVMEADGEDRPSANIQATQVFYYGHYYMAYLPMHDDRGYLEIQLAFSSDGIHWTRPWRKMFIGRGSEGAFDHGMVCMPLAPIMKDTQMVIYYGGCGVGHAGADGFMGIGRAYMRRDGFASRSVRGKQEALLETLPLRNTLGRLYLNADAESGVVTAALTDESGDPIPGYTHECCDAITDDTAAFSCCRIPLSWNGNDRLPENETVRLQLKFRNADIYSIML